MKDAAKRYAVYAAVVLIVVAAIYGGIHLLAGFGSQRGESQYTGHVVDVVEDKGMVFTPTWTEMKTNPRSSDVQSFCILPADEGELLPEFYAAMESGDRYTVTYERPLYVNPNQCRNTDAIITDIRPVNATSDSP